MRFPDYPRCNEDIRTWRGPPEYMACVIVHKTDARQLMAFRKLRLMFRDEGQFVDKLIEGLDILSRSREIRTPAGWLYDFLRKEAMAWARQVM